MVVVSNRRGVDDGQGDREEEGEGTDRGSVTVDLGAVRESLDEVDPIDTSQLRWEGEFVARGVDELPSDELKAEVRKEIGMDVIDAIEARDGESRITRQAKLIITLRHQVVTQRKEMAKVKFTIDNELNPYAAQAVLRSMVSEWPT